MVGHGGLLNDVDTALVMELTLLRPEIRLVREFASTSLQWPDNQKGKSGRIEHTLRYAAHHP